MKNKNSKFAARSSVMGFIYQFRYALLESLRRIPEPFTVSIETLDDIVFKDSNLKIVLIQTKQHLATKTVNLTNSSPDLWKTLRIWCTEILAGRCTDSDFYLVTTSQASERSIGAFLSPDKKKRDVNEALKLLNSVSKSKTEMNKESYKIFKSLTKEQKTNLMERVFVLDQSPSIIDIDDILEEEMQWTVRPSLLDNFLSRLEEWWLNRIFIHLKNDSDIISSDEIQAKVDLLREQFNKEDLPIDDDIKYLEVNESDCENFIFVHQLNCIKIGRDRIINAMEEYYQTFVQRSRWIDEGIVYPDEIDEYDEELQKKWKILFLQKKDKMSVNPTDNEKIEIGKELYAEIEKFESPTIRRNVTKTFLIRGSYHILANDLDVGWHLDFKKMRKI